jgi:hypothetical protein
MVISLVIGLLDSKRSHLLIRLLTSLLYTIYSSLHHKYSKLVEFTSLLWQRLPTVDVSLSPENPNCPRASAAATSRLGPHKKFRSCIAIHNCDRPNLAFQRSRYSVTAVYSCLFRGRCSEKYLYATMYVKDK